MSLFFISFFLAYGGMHVYAYLRANAALHFGLFPRLAVAGAMLIMVFAPMLIRMAEKQGLEQLARVFSFVGYTWLGILFLFCSASLAVDGYRLLVRFAEIASRTEYRHLKPSAGVSFYLPLVISVIIAGYGYHEAKEVRAERITIKTGKTASLGRLRIVQISDVHLGLIIRQERLKRILGLVREADPDILVSTGDLVDGQINGLSGLAEMFREVNPRYGKYAITGNHEYYAGIDQALSFTRKAGFVVLRGETVAAIRGVLNIAGVDDAAGRYLGRSREVNEKEMLSGLPSGEFTLLLKHRPLVDGNATGLFDLQLSGHVHKGQIFPFSIATKLYYPVDSGLAGVSGGSRLYVSRGTGTWGPPIRFLSPPEVTVFDLVYEPAG